MSAEERVAEIACREHELRTTGRIRLEDRDLLYKEVINVYGPEHQENKAIEEMAELTQAIIKYRHDPSRENYKNLLEEMADVQNTQEQLKMIHCNTLSKEETFTMIREAKLGKLRRELEEEEGI